MTSYERSVKLKSFAAGPEQAWALFARAPSVRFAGVSASGKPVLRTFSAVVLDGALYFHGADDGEKVALGTGYAIASYDEIVAQVPSYWVHPELACPASTYYLSAIAEGPLQRIDDLDHKARVLSAIMQRFQPEGGYAPILSGDKRYRKVLEGLLVVELRPERLSAKHKLGQHRTKRQIESVLDGLWKRGAPGDLRAIRMIMEAYPEPLRPSFLRGPDESTLCVAPGGDDAREVAGLLEGQYWTEGFTRDVMAAAQLGSQAWVVARKHGRVVASARATSDHARFAYLLDVIVQPTLRNRGYGDALLKLLGDHPALRHVRSVRLRTRTPDYYIRHGFTLHDPPGPEMERAQP